MPARLGASLLAALPLIIIAGRCLSSEGGSRACTSFSGSGCFDAQGTASSIEAAEAGPPLGSPSLLRLSLGDSPGELVIMWSTTGATAQSCAQLQPKSQPGPPSGSPASGSSLGGGGALALPHVGEQPWRARKGGSDLFQRALALASTLRGHAVALQRVLLGRPSSGVPAGQGVTMLCGGSTPFIEPVTNATTQFLHQVTLPGLDPGQQYLYRVGADGPGGGWSEWRQLSAPRAAPQFSHDQPASLLLIGDMGYLNSQTLPDLVTAVELGGVDALLHVGDLAYDLQGLQGRRAGQFLGLIEPLASRLPYMVLPGNHEVHFNFTHVRELFAMPNQELGAGLFYSFDLGPMHVLAYNTEAFYWPECLGLDSMEVMYRWMERDLQAANRNRQRTPWLIVAGHRPMYCAEARGGACDWGWSLEHEASRLGIPSNCSMQHPLRCPPTHAGGNISFPIEELLHKYGVDLAVYGHSHDYERYYPVYNLTLHPGGGIWEGMENSSSLYLNPGATVHVTSGAGGNSEMRRGPDPPPFGPCNHTAPWCAFQSGYAPRGPQSSDYSFSRVRAVNATHLHWEQYSSTLGRAVDSWWLVQHRHGPFVRPA